MTRRGDPNEPMEHVAGLVASSRPSGHESVERKALRYIAEGRLTVRSVGEGLFPIVAECRGGEDNYVLGYDAAKDEWRCTCPARGRCAHLVALQLVTRKPR
jgi:uncharacterized Zn finger protein